VELLLSLMVSTIFLRNHPVLPLSLLTVSFLKPLYQLKP
jgi:hypothetical protein